MLIPLIGLVAGILVAKAGASLLIALFAAASASAIWIAVRYASRNPVKAYKKNRWHFLWIFLIFFSLGIFTFDLQRPYAIEGGIDRYVATCGYVRTIKNSNFGDIAEVEVKSLIDKVGQVEKVSNFTMVLRADALPAKVDDEITIASPLQPIADFPNWFSNNYARRLNDRGIFYESRCDSKNITVTGSRTSISGLGTSIRSELERFIEHTRLAKETQNILITILLGDKAYLSPETRNIFSDAGISHVLALSGMHVAIIAGIVMWLLFPMNFAGLYRWRMILTVLLLLFYCFITGMSPSIVRATLMTGAVLAASLLERKNSAWNSLLLATFVILAFSPTSLFDIGLQLSFLCVASLIFFVNPLNPINKRNHPRLHKTSMFLITSIVATLGIWCVAAYYFGRVPAAFLPANILTLPLLPAYLTLSIFYLVIAAFGVEPVFLAKAIDWCPAALQKAIEWLMGGGNASIEFRPSPLTVFVWLALLAIFAMILGNRNSKTLKYSFLTISLLFLGTFVADAGKPESDAFIIQSGYRDINLHCRIGGKEHTVKVPRKAVSRFDIANNKILIIDCNTEGIELRPEDSVCDYLLMASGCTEDFASLLSKVKAKKIVIHPSIRRKKEAVIMQKADSLEIGCHSIRLHGPLHSEE